MPVLDPKVLLLDVIELIAQDIGNIKRSITRGKLSPRTANDLTRYSKALLDIISQLKEDELDTVKGLKGLSDAELLTRAQEAIDKMRSS